jgi:putative endopeptidase
MFAARISACSALHHLVPGKHLSRPMPQSFPSSTRLFAVTVAAAFLGAFLVTPAARAQSPQIQVAAGKTAPVLHALDPSLRDTSVDPCSNFYQYACGGWLKQNPIPADRASFGRDVQVEDEDEAVLRTILQKAAAGGSERTHDEPKIGDAYAACMDTAAINAAGVKPLQPQLEAVNAITSKDQLPALLAQLREKGIANIFAFDSDQDAHDATREIAVVSQPRLGLPAKSYYESTDAKSASLREAYLAHIRRTFVLLGEPEAQAQKDADTVLRLETALAAVSLSHVEMRDPTLLYHKTPLIQLAFSSYLKDVHAPAIDSLNVAEPVYFLSLHEMLGQTSLDDLKTLLRWDVVRSAQATALPASLDDERFAFYGKVMAGVPEQQPRWKRCAERVDRDLGEALGRVYVKERFTPADKQRAEDLTKAIEAAADEDIGKLDWMSAATKDAARDKLHMVANNVGYPSKWRSYATLQIKRDDDFGNAERSAEFRAMRDISKIGKPVDRTEWEMTPPTVNAYYDPQMNSINFPAGILQPPYFDPSQDDAVNYGSEGAVMGHELTHGFDDEGRQFDAEGNLRDWWTKRDADNFKERAQCVEDEYSSFVQVDALHVNGKLTLGENLADLAGLRLAWIAYQKVAEKNGTKLNGPGTAEYGGLTPAQQFFTAYGQSWCEANRPAELRMRVEVDPHSPEKYRVNGVVQNMPGFATAFQCKAGAPMAPAKRCKLW